MHGLNEFTLYINTELPRPKSKQIRVQLRELSGIEREMERKKGSAINTNNAREI